MNLIVDAHRAQTSIKVNRLWNQVGAILKILEKGTHWANRDELYIVLIKEAVCKYMHALHSPMVHWDYVVECRSLIHNTIPRLMFHNDGLNPYEVTLGAPADISNLCVYV